jgi:hypothetical protein
MSNERFNDVEPLRVGDVNLQTITTVCESMRIELSVAGYCFEEQFDLDEARALAAWLQSAIPGADPNEGPIAHGVVHLPDGSGFLPAFYNQWKCSQCGKDPRDIRFTGCVESLSCGRAAAPQEQK